MFLNMFKINLEPIYEEEGPRRAKKPSIGSSPGELTPGSTPGSRKTSQPAIKLDVIDETGGMLISKLLKKFIREKFQI